MPSSFKEILPPGSDDSTRLHASARCHAPPPGPRFSKARHWRARLLGLATACAALLPALLATSSVASANTLIPLVESFRTPELAAELLADLRLRAPLDLGSRAAVRLTYLPKNGGAWYRVVIDPPTSRSEVLRICDLLISTGFKHCTPVAPGAPVDAYRPSSGFYPFIGSFESRMLAEQLADHVRVRAGNLLLGRWVTVRLTEVPALGWRYRVVIGPLTTQDEADAVCGSLSRVGIFVCFPIVES